MFSWPYCLKVVIKYLDARLYSRRRGRYGIVEAFYKNDTAERADQHGSDHTVNAQ